MTTDLIMRVNVRTTTTTIVPRLLSSAVTVCFLTRPIIKRLFTVCRKIHHADTDFAPDSSRGPHSPSQFPTESQPYMVTTTSSDITCSLYS